MKKTTFWKSLFLLFALIVGSTSAWATDDTINNSATSSKLGNTATSSWATDFSINGASGATYYIHSMGTKNTSNALQWNANGYLYATKSGGTLKSVTITGTSGKSISVYASNSAYSTSPSGTALATMSLTGSAVTYTFTSNYTYIALKGKDSSTSITSVVISYNDAGTVAAPYFTPSSSAIKYDGTVEIKCNTEGASIYYTMGNNPANPTASSTLYTEPISITEATTIKAIAVKDNTSSTVASASYTIKTPTAPTFSLPAGEVAYNAKVAISQVDNEMILYTTDGTTPTWDPLNGLEYTEPIALTNGMTVKAIAIDGAESTSSVASATYTFAHGATMSGNVVTFDFSKSGVWLFPTDYDKTEKSYTADGYTIILGESGNGHKVVGSGIIMGKSGATLTLPAFNFKVTKIKVYGQSGSASGVTMNIYVGNTAVSTAATSSQSDHEFAINSSHQAPGTVYVYKVTNSNNAQITKIEVTGENTTPITAAGYSTFVTLDDTDFASTSGVTAYKVTNATNSTITIEPIVAAPKGTPVILKGSAATYTLTKAASTPASIDDNLLQAGGIIGDGASYYVLGKDNSNNFGFGLLANDVNLPATKAYLPAASVTGARVAFIPFDNDATAINFVIDEPVDENAPVYNLAGQRVSKSYKGIVVVNGKKVLRK